MGILESWKKKWMKMKWMARGGAGIDGIVRL